MHHRSRAILALVAAGLVSVGLAACGTSSDKTTPKSAATSSAPAEPKDVLAASVKTLADTPYQFAISGGMSGSGKVDPAKQVGEYTLSSDAGGTNMSMRFLTTGDQLYVKIKIEGMTFPGTGQAGDKWIHADPAKMGDAGGIGGSEADPFDASKMMSNLTGATRVDGTHYTGTLDLSGSDSVAVDTDVIKELGDKAKAIPFKVTLDDKGRLATLELDIPAAGGAAAQSFTVTYSHYGEPVTVTAPAASDTVDATQAFYDAFSA